MRFSVLDQFARNKNLEDVKMEHPQPVVIKKGVSIPPLLKNFVDFGFECLQNYPAFAAYCASMKTVDTTLKIQYRKTITNAANRTVSVKLASGSNIQISPINVAGDVKQFITTNNTSVMSPVIRSAFLEASKHVASIECKGPFIDFLLNQGGIGQTYLYVCVKMTVIANDMLTMNKKGVDAPLFDFMTKYSSGYVQAVARHAQKPRDSNDGLKIPWHRDSNANGEHKGMVTTGIYIHRPQGMNPESGGISFAKDGKEVRLFPSSGTVVSFLDQHVIHKVIPIKMTNSSPGFVQRSAVFMSWHTTQSIINAYGTNVPLFSRAGIKVNFRNLKKLYALLHKYFLFVNSKHARPNGKSLNTFINTADPKKVEAAYRGMGGDNRNQENYARILAEGSYASTNRMPVADLIIYKQRRTANNNTPRTKLKNLRNIYSNLKKSFGNVGAGANRTNKPGAVFAKRGGRIQHTVASSGFIRNLPSNT